MVRKVSRRSKLEKDYLEVAHNSRENQKFEPSLVQLFNYGLLKRILFNHCSTYKLLLRKEDYVTFHRQGKCRDVKELCDTLQVPYPVFDIGDATERIFVYSQGVAVPYLVLDSPVMDLSHKREVIVVFPDIFENMYERVQHYIDIVKDKPNKRFVLFNFPGQAYTMYQREQACSNDYLSSFADSLLYHLESKGYVHFVADRIKFVGFGYGGNVLLHYRKLA